MCTWQTLVDTVLCLMSVTEGPHTAGVTAAVYVSTSLRYLWHISLKKSSLRNPNKSPMRSVVGLVMWYNFGWFQPHAAMFWIQMDHYFGIPTSRVYIFKFGRVFMVFPQLTQRWLAKSITQHSTMTPGWWGTSYEIVQQPLAGEDALMYTSWNRNIAKRPERKNFLFWEMLLWFSSLERHIPHHRRFLLVVIVLSSLGAFQKTCPPHMTRHLLSLTRLTVACHLAAMSTRWLQNDASDSGVSPCCNVNTLATEWRVWQWRVTLLQCQHAGYRMTRLTVACHLAAMSTCWLQNDASDSGVSPCCNVNMLATEWSMSDRLHWNNRALHKASRWPKVRWKEGVCVGLEGSETSGE